MPNSSPEPSYRPTDLTTPRSQRMDKPSRPAPRRAAHAPLRALKGSNYTWALIALGIVLFGWIVGFAVLLFHKDFSRHITNAENTHAAHSGSFSYDTPLNMDEPHSMDEMKMLAVEIQTQAREEHERAMRAEEKLRAAEAKIRFEEEQLRANEAKLENLSAELWILGLFCFVVFVLLGTLLIHLRGMHAKRAIAEAAAWPYSPQKSPTRNASDVESQLKQPLVLKSKPRSPSPEYFDAPSPCGVPSPPAMAPPSHTPTISLSPYNSPVSSPYTNSSPRRKRPVRVQQVRPRMRSDDPDDMVIDALAQTRRSWDGESPGEDDEVGMSDRASDRSAFSLNHRHAQASRASSSDPYAASETMSVLSYDGGPHQLRPSPRQQARREMRFTPSKPVYSITLDEEQVKVRDASL